MDMTLGGSAALAPGAEAAGSWPAHKLAESAANRPVESSRAALLFAIVHLILCVVHADWFMRICACISIAGDWKV
jgi:hypothetical protein